jgi:DNA-binding transcriptional regulator LsrR (DeoR family)
MSETRPRPAVPGYNAELWAAEKVARRFYLDDRSKIQIASEMGLSRFRVARLLALARAAGIVTITVTGPDDIDGELSAAVQDRFNLRNALVLATPATADDAVLRQLLGSAAADLLTNTLTARDVLGLGWARAVLALVAALSRLAPCPVVQLGGALVRPDVESDGIELVRTVARIGGGKAAFFYAPMITATRAAARAISAQPDVTAATAQYDAITTAVIGVGGWIPPASTLYEALSPAERSAAVSSGVYADLSGVLLDSHGQPARTPLTDRIIGISASQLRAIPNLIAIAYGPEKVGAAHAAINGGYINTLITHQAFAQALLQHEH